MFKCSVQRKVSRAEERKWLISGGYNKIQYDTAAVCAFMTRVVVRCLSSGLCTRVLAGVVVVCVCVGGEGRKRKGNNRGDKSSLCSFAAAVYACREFLQQDISKKQKHIHIHPHMI
jgi:hypothetical protein